MHRYRRFRSKPICSARAGACGCGGRRPPECSILICASPTIKIGRDCSIGCGCSRSTGCAPRGATSKPKARFARRGGPNGGPSCLWRGGGALGGGTRGGGGPGGRGG